MKPKASNSQRHSSQKTGDELDSNVKLVFNPHYGRKMPRGGCSNGPKKGRNRKKERKARAIRKEANRMRHLRIFAERKRQEKELMQLLEVTLVEVA